MMIAVGRSSRVHASSFSGFRNRDVMQSLEAEKPPTVESPAPIARVIKKSIPPRCVLFCMVSDGPAMRRVFRAQLVNHCKRTNACRLLKLDQGGRSRASKHEPPAAHHPERSDTFAKTTPVIGQVFQSAPYAGTDIVSAPTRCHETKPSSTCPTVNTTSCDILGCP